MFCWMNKNVFMFTEFKGSENQGNIVNDRPSDMIVEEEFCKQRNDDVKKDISTDVASTNGSKTMVCFFQI